MTLLCDLEIKDLALNHGMIEPFVGHIVREEDGRRVLSYGLGSYGYDIRLSPAQCLVFGRIDIGETDPKNFNQDILRPTELLKDERGEYFLLPPYGYCLAVAEERIALPEDVTVIAMGKSTYARSGIITNITPAEAMWEGHLTLEISNATPLFNRIYANEGILQLMFFKGNPCGTTYADRKGKYQGQDKEVVTCRV
jgi:dCTP deaminase